METKDKLALFQEMISCNQDLCFWRFNSQGELLASNCPEESMFLLVMRHHGLIEYVQTVEEHVPIFAANDVGLTWLVVTEQPQGKTGEIYVCGPFFLRTYDPKSLEKRLQGIYMYTTGTRDWKEQLIQEIAKLPVVSLLVIAEMAVALHYLVTGQKLRSSSIHYQTHQMAEEKQNCQTNYKLKNYRAESVILQSVHEGVGDMSAIIARAEAASKLVPYTGNTLTDMKLMSIILAAQCARASVESGISVELGYTMAENYIREIWQMKNSGSIVAFNHSVIQGFAEKVRDIRLGKKYSPVIRSCIEYIEQHADEKLSIEILADRLGYTKYYLSRRFKTEVGTGINEYIRITKIELAKVLLSSTQDSVETIAEKLNISSSTYLADIFREITGMTATQYREQQLKF